MNVTYTARRSLIEGHVAGDQYTLSIDTTARMRARRTEKIQQRSLSGRIETLWYYGERTWDVTFEPVRGATVLSLQEFLDSTESGEPFLMALLGEDADTLTVKRIDDGYQLAGFLELGILEKDWFTASIQVAEQ